MKNLILTAVSWLLLSSGVALAQDIYVSGFAVSAWPTSLHRGAVFVSDHV